MLHTNTDTPALQAQRLKDTGYTLTADARRHLDRRHQLWGAVTLAACFGMLVLLAVYHTISRI